jgi:hypothetical protein
MLHKALSVVYLIQNLEGILPPVNFIKNLICLCLAMCFDEILLYPSNKMIFKRSFNKLMEDIRCN